MGYLVLARKYRPQTFAEMVGQEHVVRTLSNAIGAGQLAHAFLFTGPRGVGKTTAARLVAKAVNCEKGPTPAPCGSCPPCAEIAEGRAVDVVEIDAASNTGVDNVRDIVESVKYRPARDRYKVFVVDEVHMLSLGAFNALLKTLEEPPGHVLFVLATTDVHKVPETIVSRCQRFDFRRLGLAEMAGRLSRVAKAEGISISEGSLGLLARAAEGGMRDALSLLDRVRAACGDAPSDEAVAEAVGTVDSASVARIGAALVRRDGGALLAEVDALYQRGQEMKRVAEEVARHLRNLVVAKLAPGAPLDLTDAERREVAAQAAAAAPSQLARLFDVAQRAVAEVKLSEQPRYALEVALLKGALLAPGAEVSDLVARLEGLAAGAGPAREAGPREPRGVSFGTPGCAAGPGPSPEPPAAAPPPPAPAAAGAAAPARDDPMLALGERWRLLVAEVEKLSPSVASALKHGALVGLGEGEVSLQFPAGTSFATQVERKGADLEALFGRFFGRPTRLALSAGDPAAAPPPEAAASIAASDEAEREARAARAREKARGHPHIQEAARALDGEVAKIEEI